MLGVCNEMKQTGRELRAPFQSLLQPYQKPGDAPNPPRYIQGSGVLADHVLPAVSRALGALQGTLVDSCPASFGDDGLAHPVLVIGSSDVKRDETACGEAVMSPVWAQAQATVL